MHDESLPEAAIEALAKYGSAAKAALPRIRRFVEGPFKERTENSKVVKNAIAKITGNAYAPRHEPAPIVHAADLSEEERLFPVRHEEKQCYIDRRGRIAISTQMQSGTPFSCGRAILRDDSGRNVVIDRHGKVVFHSDWDEIAAFAEGLAAVKKQNQWGFVDVNGRVVIPPNYDSVTAFSEGFAGFEIESTEANLAGFGSIRQSGKRGFIDHFGTVSIAANWSEAYPFRNGRAAVCIGGVMRPSELFDGIQTLDNREYGYIDHSGTAVISEIRGFPGHFSEGRAAIRNYEGFSRIRCGYIDLYGDPITPLKFTSASDFHEGVAVVRCRGRQRRNYSLVIDQTGRTVSELPFNRVSGFFDGLAIAYDTDGTCGFIDVKGKWVIPPQFDQCLPFRDGLAEVQRGHWFGLINKAGSFVWGPTTEMEMNTTIESDWYS